MTDPVTLELRLAEAEGERVADPVALALRVIEGVNVLETEAVRVLEPVTLGEADGELVKDGQDPKVELQLARLALYPGGRTEQLNT